MSQLLPCQGRKANGGTCGNSSSKGSAYCHQHLYQSHAHQSGTSRSSLVPIVSSSQATFDFDELIEDKPTIITTSPKGYDGKPDTMPRNAIFRGRKVRVISYEGNNKFLVLDTDDSYRTVHRDNMTFTSNNLKPKQPKLL